METPHNINICWSDYKSHLIPTAKSWRNDLTFSDVTLVCENSQVEVHKIILASHSPFLNRILQDHHDPHPLVYLSGVKLKDMMQVLDYMYLGQVDMVMEDEDSILEMFKEFENQGCDFTNNESYSATTRKRKSTETVESPASKKAGRSPVISEDNVSPNNNQTQCSPEESQVNSSFPATWIGQDVIDDMMIKSEQNGSNDDERAVSHMSHTEQDGVDKDNPTSQDADGDSEDEVNEIRFPVDYQKKKIVKCRECSFTTDRKSNLEWHVDAKHLRGHLPRTYVCPFCTKILSTEISRRCHVKQEHNGK